MAPFYFKGLEIKEPKTKEFLKAIEGWKLEGRTLLIFESIDENVYLASRNLENIDIIDTTSVNPYMFLCYENVLIDEDGYPIIADFGCATYCGATEKTYTFCGTPKYLSPEIVQHVGHGAGADHWALGVLIYEMIQGENPFWFEGLDDATLFQGICNEEFYSLPDTVSLDAFDLIDNLLEKNPKERIGVREDGEEEILTHEWFKELDLEQMRRKAIKAPMIPELKQNAVAPQ